MDSRRRIGIEKVLEHIEAIADKIEPLQDYDLIMYPFFDSELESKIEPTTYMVNQLLEIYSVLEFIESPILHISRLVFDEEEEKYYVDGTHYYSDYNSIIEFWDSDVKSYKLAKVAYHLKHRFVAVTLDNVHRMVLLDGLKVRYRGITKIKDIEYSSVLPRE